jgi:ketosteroid isomerase-like protein
VTTSTPATESSGGSSGGAQGSGPEAKLELTTIYTVRKGKIREQEFFWDHEEALEALGLSEQEAHADS